MESTLSKASRKSLDFGTSSKMNYGSGEMSYMVDVPPSSQASKSTGSTVSIDFGADLNNA